jgi:hypothetical protein
MVYITMQHQTQWAKGIVENPEQKARHQEKLVPELQQESQAKGECNEVLGSAS